MRHDLDMEADMEARDCAKYRLLAPCRYLLKALVLMNKLQTNLTASDLSMERCTSLCQHL